MKRGVDGAAERRRELVRRAHAARPERLPEGHGPAADLEGLDELRARALVPEVFCEGRRGRREPEVRAAAHES